MAKHRNLNLKTNQLIVGFFCFLLGFSLFSPQISTVFAQQNESPALTKYRNGDFSGAIRLWAPMAIGGNPEAQFYIGDMFQSGLGVSADNTIAMIFYNESAERGYLKADRTLAEIYFTGAGVPVDMEKALQFYWSAGIKGDHISQYHLGRFYATGEGVARNEVQAYAWLDRAVSNGNKLAGPLLTSLFKGLNENQLAQAKLLSDNLEVGTQKWIPTPLNNPRALSLLNPFTKPLGNEGPASGNDQSTRKDTKASRVSDDHSENDLWEGQWQLHLGSFRDEVHAIDAGEHLERMAPNFLRNKNWVTLMANKGTQKAKFYRLRMGGYTSFEGAERACEGLILKGFACMVVNP